MDATIKISAVLCGTNVRSRVDCTHWNDMKWKGITQKQRKKEMPITKRKKMCRNAIGESKNKENDYT